MGMIIPELLFSLLLGMDGGLLTLHAPVMTAQNESGVSGYTPEGSRTWESDAAGKDREELRPRTGGRGDSPKKAGEGVVSGAAEQDPGNNPYGSSRGPKVKIGGTAKYPASSQQSGGYSKGGRKSAVGPGGNLTGQSNFGKGAGFDANDAEANPSSGFRGFSEKNSGGAAGAGGDPSGHSGFDQGSGSAADDPTTQLARLDEMKRNNLITEEEYRLLRQRILEKMLTR